MIYSYIMYNPMLDIVHCAKICVGNALQREFECLQNAMGYPWVTVVFNGDYRDYSIGELHMKLKELI